MKRIELKTAMGTISVNVDSISTIRSEDTFDTRKDRLDPVTKVSYINGGFDMVEEKYGAVTSKVDKAVDRYLKKARTYQITPYR
jgi:hypothetical protein